MTNMYVRVAECKQTKASLLELAEVKHGYLSQLQNLNRIKLKLNIRKQ